MVCKPFILKTSFLQFMWYTMVAYQIRVGAFKTYDHNLTVFHIVLLLGFYQMRVLTKYGVLTKYEWVLHTVLLVLQITFGEGFVS